MDNLIPAKTARKYLGKELNEQLTDAQLKTIITNLTQLANFVLNNKDIKWKKLQSQKL